MAAESVDIIYLCMYSNIQMLFQYILTFIQGATALIVCALMLYVDQLHSTLMSCEVIQTSVIATTIIDS